MRTALGVLAGVFVAALGALILGEYELRGVVVYIAAVLFGMAVAEAVITGARSSAVVPAAVGAGCALAGFMWAAWIESGRDWSYVNANSWIAAVVAGATAAFWIRTLGQRGARTSEPTTRTPGE